MMLVRYESKKALKAEIGNALTYQETSAFGPEYEADGTFTVAHRPSITKTKGREYFATVTMVGGKIASVQ